MEANDEGEEEEDEETEEEEEEEEGNEDEDVTGKNTKANRRGMITVRNEKESEIEDEYEDK